MSLMSLRQHTSFSSSQQLRHQQQRPLSCAQSSHPYSRRNSSTRTVVSKAQLGDMLDTVVTWGAVAASIGATVYAVFYDWQRGRQARKQQCEAAQADPMIDPSGNFTWAVMGGVSFMPLFNYMAWVLGALSSDNPRVYYWAGALYALPLLRNGFDQDWFSVTMLLLGALHIQALRIGATEPALQAKLQQQLKPLAVVKTLTNAAGTAVGAAIGTTTITSSSSSGRPQLREASSSRGVDDVLQRAGDVVDADDEVVRQQQELADFDRRLQELSTGKDE